MTLTVVRITGLATIQDLGRPGHMHEGVAHGGALVPELLVAANRAARNPDDAPAIEVAGELVVRAERELTIATDQHGAATIRAGDELVVASGERRCAYFAVRGGVAAPYLLDGRGTALSAGLGAALRAGDRVVVAGEPEVTGGTVLELPPPGSIRVLPGPDREAFAADAFAILVAAPYRVLPASNRVGTRLSGAALPRDPAYVERSCPLVRGAIEVPRDGLPIVLGPEHPTTGGYPVIAVIAHEDLGRFFAIPLGGQVQFRGK